MEVNSFHFGTEFMKEDFGFQNDAFPPAGMECPFIGVIAKLVLICFYLRSFLIG